MPIPKQLKTGTLLTSITIKIIELHTNTHTHTMSAQHNTAQQNMVELLSQCLEMAQRGRQVNTSSISTDNVSGAYSSGVANSARSVGLSHVARYPAAGISPAAGRGLFPASGRGVSPVAGRGRSPAAGRGRSLVQSTLLHAGSMLNTAGQTSRRLSKLTHL